MTKHSKERINNILKAAKTNFLEYGFKDSFMRDIAKDAGITTGAIYIYFKSKEELFEALVKDTAKKFMDMYKDMEDDYDEMSMEEKINIFDIFSNQNTDYVINFIYDNFDDFKLICCHSQGTSFEYFVDKLIDAEIESTYNFVKMVSKGKKLENNIDEELIHILMSAYFNSIVDIIKHDVKEDRAKKHMASLASFYSAGWKKLLNI